MDKDEDTKISLNEMTEYLTQEFPNVDNQLFKELFYLIDDKHTGKITVKQFVLFLDKLTKKWKLANVKQIIFHNSSDFECLNGRVFA